MGYMSPEQVRGLPVDHRTDLFSFGAILYEIISGRRAFQRDTASDTIAAILKEEPPELTQSGRDVSPALDHIVRHCLEKDRENRFQNAKDVAFALSEASSPSTAATSGSYMLAPPPRTRGKTIAPYVVAGVVAALVVAALIWTRSKHPAPAASPAKAGVRRVAVLPFENLGQPEDDYFADGIADAVRGKLTSLPGLEVIARGSSTPYKKSKKTPQVIAKELDAHYLLTATVRWQKGGGANRVQVTPELVEIRESGAPASKWQEPFDAALTDVFQVQSDIATRVAKELGVALGTNETKSLAEKPTQNLPAYEAFLRGDEATSALAISNPATVRRGLALYEQAVALDPSFAEAWGRVAIANSLIYGNSTPNPDLAQRARQAAEKAVALAPDQAVGYNAVGSYRRMVLRDAPSALESYGKALALSPSDPVALRGMGYTEQLLGHWDRAVELFRQAARVDPRSTGNLSALGAALLRTRHPVEAREAADRALALTPAALNLIELRAMTFLSEGDLPGARASLQASAPHVEPAVLISFVANYFDLSWVLDESQRKILLRLTPSAFDDDRGFWGLSLAQADALGKDAANLRLHAGEAARAFEEHLRATPDDGQLHGYLGVSLAYLGRKDEAIREGRRGTSLLPLSKDGVNGAYVQHLLAKIYTLIGEPEKALDQLEPLLKVPYLLSPGWLKIDPNFDPLRKNPRFQKLVGGAA
jgi:eukaryotic-like serine/threonine-protein kinase